ncbi:MAG: adenosine kinase [Sphingobium sp.]|nr:adenosine kinase [Sphingobium sp.]
MTEPTLDIVAIGNAIVDVISREEDSFIARHNLTKGGMQLVDAEQAEALYGAMGAGIETSGGSAANTLAGLAAMGSRCGFIGQVHDDQLGEVFAHDIRALGIRYETAVATDGPPTARCLIMVTPDAQRTMNTFLGASQFLPAAALDLDMIRSARILYLEGYLWDPEEPRAAMRSAIAAARDAGRQIAFTLSDAFVIERHRADFLKLIEEGLIDILFSNEVEIGSLTMQNDFESAVAAVAGKVPVLVVTRSEQGAICVKDGERHQVSAAPVSQVLDTTGAGDQFAAGFLAGHVRGRSPGECLEMGAIAAAEVISHYGPRPEADMKTLLGARLG